MKTHTIVGAEIVERIRFPYPSHRWCAGTMRDGTAAAIRTGWPANRFLLARGFSPPWIAWTRWHPTASTAGPCL